MVLCLIAANATPVNHKYPSYGAIYSAKVMKPDPNKVQSLQDLLTPQNQKRITIILGINQLTSTIFVRPFSQDHISLWTSYHMGLETTNRCILSWAEKVYMQDPT